MSDDPKPPYVTFEMRAVEDRNASLADGAFRTKDVAFAIITPAGTRDRIEKVAEDWLRDLEEGVRQERIPPTWLQAFRYRFKMWTEDHEVPDEGLPVTQWPAVSPAQVRLLQDMGIRSVEQLAEATEEAVMRMGMGGRALKAKAQAWLDSASGTGKVASELEKLRIENEALKARDAERDAKLQALEAKLGALTAKDSE